MRYGNPSKKTKTIASKVGHSIEFPGRGTVDPKSLPPPSKDKDEAKRQTIVDAEGIVYVHVPSLMRPEVAAAGMQSEDDIEEADDKVNPVKPADADELKKAAYEAFDLLVADANRDSFAATGVPKPQAVEKLLGYPLTNNEVKELWSQYMVDTKGKSST